MPATTAAKTATPQTAPKPAQTNGAATPASRPPPPTTQRPGAPAAPAGPAVKSAMSPAAQPKKGFTAPPAAAGGKKVVATPGSGPAAAAAATPASNGGMPTGSMSNYGYNMSSGYGGSFVQQPGAAASMYGMQPNGSMYPGVGMSSMYGTQGGGGYGMYSSAYNNPMMAGGPGSQYNMGSMHSMGSMGGGYGFASSFGGSLYGGTMYGAAGSLYGTGGSLYGGNDPQSVMGSMYGSRGGGSIYGGFGSIYAANGPHMSYGTVRKYSMPGFSYTFGSNLGTEPYQRGNSFGSSRFGSRRGNSFANTSTILRDEEQPASGDRKASGKGKGAAAEAAREKAESGSGAADRQRGATGVDKDGEGHTQDVVKPESIMKKRASVEAPKSPPRVRPAKAGVQPGPVLSSDFRVHNVAILDESGSAPAKLTKQGDACVLGGTSYAMDEVIEYGAKGEKAEIKSRHVQDMIEHALAGHNAALLVSDDGKATATATKAVEAAVTALLEAVQNPARNSYAGVSATVCELQPNNMVRDLLASGAQPTALELGNSPLCGPAVMNLRSEPVASGADFHKLLEAAQKRGEKTAMMVCLLTLKQVHAGGAAGKEDVFLSSLLIAVSRSGPKAFHDVIDKVSSSAHDLFRYAVDGPSVAVHLVALHQSLEDPQVLKDCAKVGEVQNTAPRSGNVRRFVEFTEEQARRMKERSGGASGAEKRELDVHVKRLSQILEDAQKFLSDPKGTEPTLYRIENDNGSPAGTAATDATAAAAVTDGARKASPSGAAATREKDGKAAEAEGGERAGEDAAKGSAQPEEKPRGSNVATVALVDAADSRAYAVKGDVITAGGRPFNVDEVVQRADMKAADLETAATKRVVDAFLRGYNGAIVASDSAAVAANGMESPTLSVVMAAAKGALEHPGCKGVRVSFALVRDTGKASDLTSADATPSNIEVSSSPLFGPVVHNATLHRVRSLEDMQQLVDKARANVASAGWDEHCAVHVSLLHCFAEKEDVMVSSLLATFASNSGKPYADVLQHRKVNEFTDLYRYAFGGAATTAFVVSVCSEDEVADVVNALSTQKLAGAVRNRSPRQGSIKNFATYTAASLEKRNQQLASMPDGSAEKQSLKKVMGPMERMLGDHRDVLEDPEKHFPRAYAAESGAGRGGVTSPTPASALANGAAAKNGTAGAAGTPAAVNAVRSRATPADAASPADAAQHEDPAAAGFTEPRVVVLVGREVAQGEKKVSLANKDYAVDEVVQRGEGQQAPASGAVTEMEGRFLSVHNCAVVAASSVLGDSTAAEPVWAVYEQCLRSAMAGGRPGEEVRVEMTFAVISQDELLDDLLADAPLASPQPLEVTSSPIYGPRVSNVAMPMVRSAEEVAQVMAKAHERAAAHVEAIRSSGALMVGTAMLRRKAKDGDVEVAALMGTLSGASVKAYREALEKEPVVRRTLLNCAFGGPSTTVTMVNLGDEDAAAQEMVATAVALSKKQRNLSSRSGSVLAFVKYTEGTMKRELNRAATATAAEAKERHQQKAERLRPVVEDHKRLLADFDSAIPAYSASRSVKAAASEAQTPSPVAAVKSSKEEEEEGEAKKALPSPAPIISPTTGVAPATPQAVQPGQESPVAEEKAPPKRETPAERMAKPPSGSNPIHTVLVVTPSRGAVAAASVARAARTDETHLTVTMDGADRVCECDEAVARPDASSLVRADMLDTAVQQFVAGFNTALLCCDVDGSNAGPVACLRVVHRAAETRPEKAELFAAVNLVKDGTSRNMLGTASTTYSPMRVANSPIFGPWIHGVEMTPFGDVADFDKSFASACSTASHDGAMVVVHLVLKILVEENGRKDVLLSSLLVSLTTSAAEYAAVVNAPPKANRSLFQYAVQGSCFTVGLLGMADKGDASTLRSCLDTFDKLHETKNRTLRNGSVRHFYAYSTNAMADVRKRAESLTDEKQRAVYQQRLSSLERMLADSREMLESPQGRPLKVYL